jgi:predicted ATPase
MLVMIFGRDNSCNEKFAKTKCKLPLLYPEKYLHPAKHPKLMDEFIKLSNKGMGEVMVTHSEHMLARLQRRIAEGKIKKESVELWNVKGEKATRLKLEDSGCIKNWVKDFFGDLLGECCDRTINYLNRKKL